MKQKIPFSQVSQANGTKAPQLPKYSSSVINSASGYAHATDPKNVGMASQEIQVFCNDTTTEHNLEDWKTWHLKHHENGAGINRAIDQAWEKFQTMRESLNAVTRENVAEWMEDFVYNKTYDGLMVQKAVIKAIADKIGVCWRLANAQEEHQGIDGFINNKPVQIKADSYKQTGKKHNETTTCPVVFYHKENKSIIFDYEENWFK